ncbi:GCN5 family acetyltransferase [Kiloniella litopenaei]|uniref:GCN5 family acetyltransferase n=1 Tax=Kiloniella litopenaei TaxID=1549748 RepID=A0A0M2RCK0_9PROT|nr:GNAT family N-acetyltransferase [Kiloniella litopenaei]KKJ77720.1 GCN5 family acetyltransferase [Kiloniella litopenaei]
MPSVQQKIILETDRLIVRELGETDAPFILRLLNDPAFIKNIVDKEVRTLDQACEYINSGPVASYRENGFGLYVVILKEGKASIGMCGLVKRDGLDDPDIGYALLPEYCSKGYAAEAADAVLRYGHDQLGLEKIVGIVNPDNTGSARVLEKIGLTFEKMIKVSEDLPETKYYVSGKATR